MFCHFSASDYLCGFAAEFQGIPLPENTSIVLAVVGEGVQIYESKPNSTGTYAWALKAPEAELQKLDRRSSRKALRGTNLVSERWKPIGGQFAAAQGGNAPEGRNIPWLLVAAKSRSDAGLLSKIDYVVRIATSGGVAPEEAPQKSDRYRQSEVSSRSIYFCENSKRR